VLFVGFLASVVIFRPCRQATNNYDISIRFYWNYTVSGW